MKIFVGGCSFSSYKSGRCGVGKSWPHLLAKQHTGHQVYDCTYGGAGNDTLLHRLQILETNFGKPEKVIIQLTTPARTGIIQDKMFWKLGLGKQLTRNNLFYYDLKGRHWEPVTGAFFHPDTEKMQKKLKKNRKFGDSTLPQRSRLSQFTGLSKEILTKYFAWHLDSYDNSMRTQMTINLINRIYGQENVFFFSWHRQDKFNSMGHINLPKNYIGSVEEKTNKLFYSYAMDESPHYGVEGHKVVYEWLEPYVHKLLREKIK